ncbi:hypothetical protein PROH_01130 [Prochlorothrix hollandica PCC 9006 = CALU 1027]|uniref:Uncharacterized protein n=1 Tax=Prochlorothrix hollandica PCC 9006 = CALU 1027 TaxID=317619 RepID=A0A0M2PXZ9_PROHO|nr:hypothetical protein PROH_01130 [Prochlorothrix hollandica PCC 9006 = CALU 1027]
MALPHWIQSERGTRAVKSPSMASAWRCWVRPKRWLTRIPWVSTMMPDAWLKAQFKTTLAVLRPTPGKLVSASRLGGTFPPKRAISSPQTACTVAALRR